jgi:hypothetical protein
LRITRGNLRSGLDCCHWCQGSRPSAVFTLDDPESRGTCWGCCGRIPPTSSGITSAECRVRGTLPSLPLGDLRLGIGSVPPGLSLYGCVLASRRPCGICGGGVFGGLRSRSAVAEDNVRGVWISLATGNLPVPFGGEALVDRPGSIAAKISMERSTQLSGKVPIDCFPFRFFVPFSSYRAERKRAPPVNYVPRAT